MKKEHIHILVGVVLFCIIAFLLYRENTGFTLGFLLAIFLFQFRINRKIDEQNNINKQIADNFMNQFKMIENNTKMIETIIAYLQGIDKKAHLN